MCGIFGIYYFDKEKKVDEHIVREATNLMTHRGPDDSGFFVDKNIGLGHRRLSIIDIATGHQPMFNEDGSITVVYNGEIYNFLEIKKSLQKKGHIFKTNCDTEVIIHAYEEWGADCVHKFNGMFAFGLWDSRNQHLWIARDRLGIKPLYYYRDSEKIVFSSEIKPILKATKLKTGINENVLDAYFSLGYVPAPETMFKNIYKLKPGHFLYIKNSLVKENEYWDLTTVHPSNLHFDDAKERLQDLLMNSIDNRLLSDVPLGIFLSGGLDSSAIVALTKNYNSHIDTFTVGYHHEYGISEEKYAQAIADKYQTNHHLYNLEPDDFFQSIKTLVQFAEEPIVEPAAIALYHLSKLARESAIVLLSGEGSDEIFAGYFLYNVMRKINRIQKFAPPEFWKIFSPLRSLMGQIRSKKYFDWLCLPLNKRYQGTSSYLTEKIKNEIYSDDFFQTKGQYLQDTFSFYFDKIQHSQDILNRLLYIDTKTWLVDRLLLKADKMTMAASVELRVPFLDHRIVELATSLPSYFKSKNGNGKYILKSIMEHKLPDEIVFRKKMGFPIPTQNWLAGDLLSMVEDTILNTNHLPWFKKSVLEKTIAHHKNRIEDHSTLLMTLLVIIFWQQEYV